MAIAWGLSQYCPPFIAREEQLRTRGMRPMQVRVAIARHACRLIYRMLTTQDAFDEQPYRRARHQVRRGRRVSYAPRRRNLACRPPDLGLLTAKIRACRTTATHQPADPRPTRLARHSAIPPRGDAPGPMAYVQQPA